MAFVVATLITNSTLHGEFAAQPVDAGLNELGTGIVDPRLLEAVVNGAPEGNADLFMAFARETAAATFENPVPSAAASLANGEVVLEFTSAGVGTIEGRTWYLHTATR